MLLFNTLHCFLLAGICICVDGTPVPLPDVKSEQDLDCYGQCIGSLETTDVRSESSGGKHVTSLFWKVGAGGGAGPHGRSEGTALVTQTEKGDSLDGRSGLSEAGEEVWRRRSLVKKVGIRETGDAHRQSTSVLPVYPDIPTTSEAVVISTGGRNQMDGSTMRFPPGGFLASFTALPQMNIAAKESRDQIEEEQSKPFPYGDSVRDKEPSFGDQEWSQKLTPHSPIPPLVFVSPQTSTSPWGHDGATTSFLPDPLLPEIGSNLMPREDGPENLWTEAMRPSGVGTVVPLSQDEATEGTMSSEALPLIFEPLEDATSERAQPDSEAAVTSATDVPQHPATIDLDLLDTVETDSDSRGLPPLKQDWMSPWQTSGTEQLEPVRHSGPSVSPWRAGTVVDPHSDRGAVRMQELEENIPTNDPLQHAPTTKTSSHQPAHKSRSGLEEMESDEEPDEDEENSEESLEDESEEDLTEMPKTSSTQPPYSLIPPPPVWVQRNQGLMRSWLELIREKAGYVSGMLAPVGIGITGALLIVGALYSIRMIHRKRRNSFKHQRMKVRQPEQLGESGTSRQDQAMLLADSSEDEF